MKPSTLIARSLRFYWRTHLGVLAGAAIATAVLAGALLVGDSVRYSLKRFALLRLGDTQVAIDSGGRFFRAQLADELAAELAATVAPVLSLNGTAAAPDGSARVGRVQVLGVEDRFWSLGAEGKPAPEAEGDTVIVNERLGDLLGVGVGETLLLRVENPSALPRDAPLSRDADARVAVRLKVAAVAGDEQFGRFSLRANQIAPPTALVPLSRLQRLVDLRGRANMLLVGGRRDLPLDTADAALRKHWKLADAQLTLRELPTTGVVELRSERIFLDPPVAEAAAAALPNAQGVLTYFVNSLRVGERTIPYSMVAAIGPLARPDTPLPSIVPAEMTDGEILINDWAAKDLHAAAGDEIEIGYYVLGPMRRLITRVRRFTVRGVVPLAGPAGDATLGPDFPGITDSASCRDWDPGIPIDLTRIRPSDEQYWDDHRGTPKAFVTLRAGRRMWANRFGDLTAVRFRPGDGTVEEIATAIRAKLDPAAVGLFFRPVRAQALAAGEQALDFGQLFLGLSFFLIAAAVLLMGLLFVFGVQQRTGQIGTLIALGFSPRYVRWLLAGEGGVLAVAGAAIGALAGTLYTRAMLHGLATVWSGAVAQSAIRYRGEPLTLLWAVCGGAAIAFAAMWITLRGLTRRSARELLSGEAGGGLSAGPRAAARWTWAAAGVASVVAAGAIVAITAGKHRPAVGAFFAAGALLLVAGIAFCGAVLGGAARARGRRMTLGRLAVRNTGRRRGRSLAVAGLLACGSFLVVSVGAFRLGPPGDPYRRQSGTGGFALFGVSALPVFRDLNTPPGRKAYGLTPAEMEGVRVVAMRARDGDDASCLNLNRAQRPQLLGVPVEELRSRDAFTFARTDPAIDSEHPWGLLDTQLGPDIVPAVGDETTVVWGLGKDLGDEVDYTDERGRSFRLRIVGVLANSLLQGSLLISEEQFIRRFPSQGGYRAFLIDAPPDGASRAMRALSGALEDEGADITPASERLAAFNTVQNTYLAIFQALGGLGLLLGSVGLGVVVMRNVLERRSELALLRAVGFGRGTLHLMILFEHWGLLAGGLCSGVVAALLAVLPVLRSGGTGAPWALLALILTAVAASGAGWIALATHLALRGPLLDALRTE